MVRILFVALFTCVSLYLQAQDGTIRGFIHEAESGEPVIFTNVYLKGTNFGSSTDVNGYFSITKVTPGTYTLMVTSLGYDTLQEEVSITAGAIINKRLELSKASIEIMQVEISGERAEALTQVQMSVNKVTPREIQSIPTIGGSADLVQYLQVLPGVIFTGDQGGQLYIRGGTPIQNKVLLDGMVIYNPFHSIGLFSVFNTEIIRNADVYTGGFGAQYGGRISSIMDITTIDGNKRRVSGSVSATTFLAEAMVEGPLSRQKEGKNGASSFVFTAKHSYLDQSSKSLYSHVDGGLPYSFTDLYGKVSFSGGTGSKFNVFGFNFTDQVKFQGISDLNWESVGGGTNFVLAPVGNPVLIEGNFSISQYNITLEEAELSPRESSINSFDFGLGFKYFKGDNELKYGIDILGFGTSFNFFNAVGRQFLIEDNNTEIGGYFTYKAKISDLVLDAGIRMQYYSSLRVFSPEPRLGLKYNVTERFRLKAAGGRFTQNLIAANSDRDVVNLFYGFLAGPENLQNEIILEDGTSREISNPLQQAYHVIAGFEFDVNRYMNINIEGYYKRFHQMSNINRNKVYPSNRTDVPEVLRTDFIVETGDAQGIDFNMKYERNRLYLWAVYSLSKVDRWDGLTSYAPVFDRRHNVNLIATYTFGKNRDYEVSARWNFGSGFPFTQNQGAYLSNTFTGGINSDYITGNGDDLTLQYGPLNEGRLPDYHRFDLSLKKTFTFSDVSSLELNASVSNVYNRENVFYVNRITSEILYQLPIIPSFGLTYRF